ncbi:MAG: S-layer homology domain-containing protein, partial [bacterium]
VAAQKGITTGYTDGKFGPLDNIRRSQISTMIVRAAQSLEPGKLVEAPDGFLSDWGDFSDVHGPFANTAQYSGLFEWLQFDFYKDPFKMATRGEVAQLLWNLKTFVKQTKTGVELVTMTDVTTSGTPTALKAAIEAKAGAPVDWIRRLYIEHPVNASVHFSLIYARAGGGFYSAAQSPQGPVAAPLIATFLTYLQKFGAEVGYAYFDPTDPQNPKVAGLLNWRLGGAYLRQGTETLGEYTARIQPLMDSFVQQHADADELFSLSDPAVRQLIKTSLSLGINQASDALAGVRVRVDLYRAYGYGDVIDKIADGFWPWED